MGNPFNPDLRDLYHQRVLMNCTSSADSTEYHDAHIAALENQLKELRRQADAQQAQNDELRRQANAQEQLNRQLAEEAAARAKDDKKYFWLGALTSFIVSMLVTHGAALLRFVLQLFQA